MLEIKRSTLKTDASGERRIAKSREFIGQITGKITAFRYLKRSEGTLPKTPKRSESPSAIGISKTKSESEKGS